KISKIAFRNKKYIIYFISEFNREHIGNMVSRNFYIDKEIADKIKNEVKKIDIDKLFLKLPEDERESLSFIKEIMSFKFVYMNFHKASKLSEEVEKEKDTIFIGGSEGKIHKLKNEVYKFWEFITENYLMVNNYREVKRYFNNYIESVLFSYSSVKEKVEEDKFFGIKGKTIKINEIDYFMFFIMTKHLKRKQLKYLFNKYEIYEFKLNDDDLDKLIKAFENVINSVLRLKNYRELNNIINRFLYILSFIDIGKDNYLKIIDGILNLIQDRSLPPESFRNLLSFIIGQNNRFKDNMNIDKLDKLLRELLFMEIKNEKNKDLYFGTKIFKVIPNIINYNDDKYITKNNKLISLLIENNKKLISRKEDYNKGINRLIDIIIPMHKVCNNKTKEKIKQHVNILLEENFNIFLYYEAVMNEIVKSNHEFEELAVKSIRDKIENRKNSSSKKIPNPVKNILIKIGNLYLNEKLISPELFFEFKTENEIFNFLINIEDYDYSEFKIEWIEDFKDSLHKKISKNDKAKKIIKEKLKKKVINENVNKNLKKIFFNYYD
ncbi:MAG: hypothetical protein ACQEQF_12340, partial [Bacillota bacterium]